MEPKGEAAGVRVYDSYAHHPTEIAGDLAAARALAGDGRLVVAFQPHLVSRTRVFGAAMGEALGAADEVVVCDVYLAREDPDPAVTGATVADAVPAARRRRSPSCPDLADVAAELVSRARPGDLVLTLGAGDVTTVGPQVLELLGRGSGPMASPRPGGRPHPAAVRAAAVAAPLARVAVRPRGGAGPRAASAACVYAVWFSLLAGRRGRSRSAAPRPSPPTTIRERGRRSRTASRWCGSTSSRPSRGSGRWRWSRSVEVTRQWPDRVLISIEEREAIAVVEIGGRLRGMDAEGVVFRDYRRAPVGLPAGARPSIGTTAEALREAAAVISALPESLTLLVDHVEVDVGRRDLAGAQGRPGRGVGELGGLRDQGRGARSTCSEDRRPRSTTSASHASRPPARPSDTSRRLAAACRRHPAASRPYCHRHRQVDITITLRLRVTVRPTAGLEERGPWQQRRTTWRSSRSWASAAAGSTPSTG